ncbi:MAG TPA: PKD domain-containing protein [Chitinophagaceae bacterium]|nr:PKD domain-containing protein [Chitinophagaceae bacterium]
MRKITIIILLLLCHHPVMLAQQNNNWYFGAKAGLSFNNVTNQPLPFALTNGAMISDESSTAISDSTGKLLFYTNGVTVYNRLHQVMLNGDNLKGNESACQGALITPMPGSDSLYYIFTTDAIENSFQKGYNYSVVDMSRDNGNGEVIEKNTPLWASCTERLAAARHANGVDVWIITNDNDSDIFRAWLLTCNGLQPTPVVSLAGVVLNQHIVTNTGYMKVSPDGSQLCQTHLPLYDPDEINPNFIQLFDFNNNTGQITNARSIAFGNAMYVSCEYSPDSRMLYLTRTYERKLDQLEAKLVNPVAIGNSTITFSTPDPVFSLQLGPDEKIYAFNPDDVLGTINYPNQKGIACGYVHEQTSIAPRFSRYASPSCMNDVAYDPNNGFSFTIIDSCTGTVQFNGLTGLTGTLVWEWDFGDGNTSTLQNPMHTFNPPNQAYEVKLKISSLSHCGTIRSKRIIKPGGSIINADFDFVIRCDSGYIRFINKSVFAPNEATCLWDFGDGNTSVSINPVHTYAREGMYNVKLKLITGTNCLDDSMELQVDVKSFTVNVTPAIQTIVIGQPVFLSTEEPANTYQWSPGKWLSDSATRSPVATPLEDMVYRLRASNNEGCTGEDSVIIKVIQYNNIYVPTAFTPDNNGRNDILRPHFGIKYELKEFNIYNRWGVLVFTTQQLGIGWDGRYKGNLQDAGVYIWLLKATDADGKIIEKKGNFLLIR